MTRDQQPTTTKPGRKPQNSSSRKRQLSSDAKIIVTLSRKQPQTKEEICEETKISGRTFYRTISLLEKQQITKRVDNTYALSNFDPIEKAIENIFSQLTIQNNFVSPNMLVKELRKPWYELEAVTYKIAAKLGINIEESDLGIYFCKPT